MERQAIFKIPPENWAFFSKVTVAFSSLSPVPYSKRLRTGKLLSCPRLFGIQHKRRGTSHESPKNRRGGFFDLREGRRGLFGYFHRPPRRRSGKPLGVFESRNLRTLPYFCRRRRDPRRGSGRFPSCESQPPYLPGDRSPGSGGSSHRGAVPFRFPRGYQYRHALSYEGGFYGLRLRAGHGQGAPVRSAFH